MKGTYECPVNPPINLGVPRELTESEALSLDLYVAWRKSNGTELAYKLHGKVLQRATQTEILSLYSVKKLAMNLSGLKPRKIDMCPKSCMAYTGDNIGLSNCCYVKDNVICNEARYNAKRKPRAQMIYVSCFDVIKAMYANVKTSDLLRSRDWMLQHTLSLLRHGTDKIIRTYSDFGDSAVQEHLHYNLNVLQKDRDIALALSTDGAQLTMKKQSNTWIALLILLNLPAEIHYQTSYTMVSFIIPGPYNPGDIESFMHPLFEDMAKANEGIWMWDAVDSSYFVCRACICMILGDMLGSAKVNGMAGHSAFHGDRFSMVEGARSNLKKGSKYQYYPIKPPGNAVYNPSRPKEYNLNQLPIRTENFYWDSITRLHNAQNKTQLNAIVKQTGISRMPLAAASPAFVHPSFFPMDPFHIFFENIVPLMWDIWTIYSAPEEDVHLSKQMAQRFGQLVVDAMKTLPPSFSGPVRDPHLKRQSQYKAFEWMALLYWYIIPIGIELGFDGSVLKNFSKLIVIIEEAMTIKKHSDKDLEALQGKINDFLVEYEEVYVGKEPKNISRCRLCIFQLVHIPMHIRWYGSIQLGSQSTVERTIGEAGHKIHSKKSPFANLANIFFEKELIRVVQLYYPDLGTDQIQQTKPVFFGRIKIKPKERSHGQDFYYQLEATFQSQKLGEFNPTYEAIERYGKCNLHNGRVLTSMLSELVGRPSRSRCYFEAHLNQGKELVFGKALAFFNITQTHKNLVIYHKLGKLQKTLNVWRGEWSEEVEVMEVSNIADIVGIWAYNKRVYPLRKHSGFGLMLNDEKQGEEEEEEEEG